MAIPENITRADIVQAFKEIDNMGIPTNREPQGYYLIFNKKAYPPKYVVSIANKYRNGEELPSNVFNSIEAGRIFLRDRGFAIVKIDSLVNTINTLQNIINNKNQYPQLASKFEIEHKILSKYHEIFSLNHLQDLSSDEILGFLKNENNQLWDLNRHKTTILQNFEQIKKGLALLFDESISIDERLNQIEQNKKENGLSGLGPATLTAFLYFYNPEKYGILNSTSENALKEYDILPPFKKGVSFGEKYAIINEIFCYLASEMNISLWSIDVLWYKRWTSNEINPFSTNEFEDLFLNLKRFVTQSLTSDLTTKSYIESIGIYKVAKSFGQGTPANVTWMNFFKPDVEIKSIHSLFVSFYFDKKNKLFLVLGVKESDGDENDWPESIHNNYPRFSDINVSEQISKRYPKSRIFSEFLINPSDIDGSLESQKNEIKSNLADALILYNQIVGFTKKNPSSNKINYWRVAPGRHGILWRIWKEENFCSIGYHEYEPYLQELLQIQDKNTFYTRLIQIAKENENSSDFSFMLSSQPYAHQYTLWSFIHEMKIGDIVIASTGRTQIYGIGTINSNISIRDANDYSLIRDVKWKYVDIDASIPQEIRGNFNVTLNMLSPDDYSKIIRKIEQKDDFSEDAEDEIDTDDPIVNLLHRKGQIILYGPPGTGKTYHVQDLVNKKSRNNIKITTKELNKVFWTYLDRNNFPDFSTINTDTIYTYQWSNGWRYDLSFDKISVGDILICFGWKDYKIVGVAQCTGKTTSSFQYQFLDLTEGPTYKTLLEDPDFSRCNILKSDHKPRIQELDYSCFERIVTLAGIPSDTITIESQIKEQKVKNTEFITFHQSFSYEEFIEGLRPITDADGRISYSVKEGIFKELCRTAYNTLLTLANIDKRWNEDQDVPNLTDEETQYALSLAPKVTFYLVIDEINRGDISRIFGELITLLEKDKRLLAPHEITTKLPSSRTRFGIPPNLFLIGTMNTADKSIALIDIALRRRFGFIEMMPDYDLLYRTLSSDDESLLEVYSIAIALLRTINQRILEEHDREHQIGHSFLLKLKDARTRDQAIAELSMIWYHEVIPLLHEYFYDAPRKLFKVMGPEFMKSDPKCIYFYPEKEGESFLSACKSISKGYDLNGISSTDAL